MQAAAPCRSACGHFLFLSLMHTHIQTISIEDCNTVTTASPTHSPERGPSERTTLKPSTGPTSVGYQQKTSFKKRRFIIPTVFLTEWKSIEGLLTLAGVAAQWNRCAGFEQWSHGTASQRREIADSAGSCSTYLLTHTMTSSWLFWSHQAIAASSGTKRGRQTDIKTGQIKRKGVWAWVERDFWAPGWGSKGTGLKPRSADTPPAWVRSAAE